MVNALILAGGEKEQIGLETNVKALIKINERPMVEYVIHALQKCELVDKIGIIGSHEKLRHEIGNQVDYIIEGKGSIIQNVVEGVKHMGIEHPVLICTSDIPMLTDQAIRDFINRSMDANAELCYPIVEKEANEKKYPGIERTYVTIKDGTFTGGNIFFIKPQIIETCSKKAEELIAQRKNVIKMARTLGLRILCLLLLKRLTIAHTEKKVSEIFNISAIAIISDYPEIANDVDKASHLKYVRNQLKNKK